MSAAEYPLAPDPSVEWSGAKRRYDLVKEASIAFVVVLGLVVLLSAVFSSPDVPPVTLAQWATKAPQDFLATAVAELNGTSGVATYGPPYTHVAGAGQIVIGGFSPARVIGVQIPIHTARAFVLSPLGIPAESDPVLAQALRRYERASKAQQHRWTQAYEKKLVAASGPVGTMMSALLQMARSGGLDGALDATNRFYPTNATKALLFLTDGSYLESLAQRQHLLGSQWGMMNETGNYPGQAWLWLYTFWYQIKPFSTSANADAQIWAIMGILSLAFVLIPFIPGVRSIPRWIPLYKLIWRDYYREARRVAPPAAG